MPLNKQKGNMYGFIDYTWNTIKGKCPHDCSYCYMKRWGQLNPVHFDRRELKTDLDQGKFIFVGSSCDMFAEVIPFEWIFATLEHCKKFDNLYMFQSKDPERMAIFMPNIKGGSIVTTTIETNRAFPVISEAPKPYERLRGMQKFKKCYRHVTIEPIMDFDLQEFVEMIREIGPKQVNIGADTQGNNLPEPPGEKVFELMKLLKDFTTVVPKKNLSRLL